MFYVHFSEREKNNESREKVDSNPVISTLTKNRKSYLFLWSILLQIQV